MVSHVLRGVKNYLVWLFCCIKRIVTYLLAKWLSCILQPLRFSLSFSWSCMHSAGTTFSVQSKIKGRPANHFSNIDWRNQVIRSIQSRLSESYCYRDNGASRDRCEGVAAADQFKARASVRLWPCVHRSQPVYLRGPRLPLVSTRAYLSLSSHRLAHALVSGPCTRPTPTVPPHMHMMIINDVASARLFSLIEYLNNRLSVNAKSSQNITN